MPSYLIIGGALASFAWYYPFALPLLAVPVGMLVTTSLTSPEPRNREDLRAYLSSAFQSVKNRQVRGLFTFSLFTFIILSVNSFISLLKPISFPVAPFAVLSSVTG